MLLIYTVKYGKGLGSDSNVWNNGIVNQRTQVLTSRLAFSLRDS